MNFQIMYAVGMYSPRAVIILYIVHIVFRLASLVSARTIITNATAPGQRSRLLEESNTIAIFNQSSLAADLDDEKPHCEPYVPGFMPRINLDDCLELIHYQLRGDPDVDRIYTWSWARGDTDKQLIDGDGNWEHNECEVWVERPLNGILTRSQLGRTNEREAQAMPQNATIGPIANPNAWDSFSYGEVAETAEKIFFWCLGETRRNNGGNFPIGHGRGFTVEVGLLMAARVPKTAATKMSKASLN